MKKLKADTAEGEGAERARLSIGELIDSQVYFDSVRQYDDED